MKEVSAKIYELDLHDLVRVLAKRMEIIDQQVVSEQLNNTELGKAGKSMLEDKKVEESQYLERIDKLITENERLKNEILQLKSANVSSSVISVDQAEYVKKRSLELMERVVDTLNRVDCLIPCNNNTEETDVMQNALRKGAEKTFKGLVNLDLTNVNSISLAQRKIQQFLLDEMKPISCWMRKLAIYSAYANIPFMIDEARTDGIRFNRESTVWSYALLDDMLAGVGIKQIVPAPFIELISDGDYEDASESAIKNIGFFCPDYIQRISNIDRVDTKGIIVDIADVGLMIDGELYRQAKVII